MISLICIIILLGLFDDPSKSAEIANSVDDTEQVYFVPAFSGLGVSLVTKLKEIFYEIINKILFRLQ